MIHVEFQEQRRYRLTIQPAGSRSKTVTREMNYLGTDYSGDHLFDARPEGGTQTLREESILEAEDIGPAIWERR